MQFRDMPLVGRAGLVDYLLSGVVDKSASYVLAGSAGVGKSRLAAEVARGAASQGLATAHVAATRGASTIPFGAFAALMPEIVEPPGGLTSVLQRAIEVILERGGRSQRHLIVVDDAHLLDDGSAALVHQVALESSCSLVVTIRSTQPAPDPITALWKDNLAERLDIGALTEPEVKELLASSLGAPATDAAVRWVWSVSAGNPLYVREVLIAALDAGALRDDGGVWTIRLPLPSAPRLAELVATRLAGLRPETADVVDLVALADPLPLDVLGAIVAADALEDAESRGIVRLEQIGDETEVRMDHPIYGEVRRQEILPVRMRRLCVELARAMEAREPPRPGDDLRTARWQLEAGLPGDPELLGRAAMVARHMFDLDLATRLAKASLDAGGGILAGVALGEADFYSGRPEQAEQVLAALVPQCVGDDEISRVANARSYNLGVMLGDKVAAVQVLDEALEIVTEQEARHRLLNRRATTDVYSDRPRAALADARELIASGDDAATSRGAYVAAFGLSMLGRGDEAVEMSIVGTEALLRSEATHPLPSAHLIGAVLGLIGTGDLEEAEKKARRGYESNAEINAQEGVATFAMLRGMLYVQQGYLEHAGRVFREAVVINRELHDYSTLRWCLGGVALAAGMAGDAAAAAAAIAELDEIPQHWMDALDADLVLRGRAWAMAAAGELTAARRALRDAVATALVREQLYSEARLLHDLARLGEPGDVATRLHEVAGQVEGKLVEAFAADADALAQKGGPDLEKSAEVFEKLGAIGIASETFRAASAAFSDKGLVRTANACARRGAELAERCGNVGISVVGQGGAAARLTRREREIAGLAASGLSSAEISERLVISVRTVENHLSNIYLKLGVSGRHEIAGALRGG
jgi:DNA-binding CsgD family transcriptional regulator